MRSLFVPKEFKPPEKVNLGKGYILVPISTRDTLEDWLVITNNAEIITKIRGGGSRREWPFVCTLEENFKDLSWLECCGHYKQLFSYILRRKSDNAYLGCVYIYPIELFFPEKADLYDVDFSFWIIQSEFDKGKYEEIFEGLLDWLEKDWPFDKKRIFLRNQIIPKKYQRRETK